MLQIKSFVDVLQNIFFSSHTYTRVQFEQLHKYIKNRNKVYKTKVHTKAISRYKAA